MLVFIDESGDPGFKLSKGSSPIFVISMVMFADPKAALSTQTKIEKLRLKLRVKPEFKFSRCKDDFKDEFFKCVADSDFRARFVVVQKDRIHSPALRTVKESFYKFFIRMMMTNDGGDLKGAKVVIDGSGDREFKRQFKAYLRRNISVDCVRDLELKDSVRDSLIQLADMTAGAIARSYRTDREQADRWRKQLLAAKQIGDIWEFK